MTLSDLQVIYADYADALGQAHKKSSLFSGLFGQGSFDDPRSDPCNKAFYENTGAWVASFAGSGPDEPEVYAVSLYMLEAAKRSEKKPTYWYYLVAQGYVKELIPLLSREHCRELAERYVKWYPKRQQLKLQQEVYELLRQHA